jgi:hypothetical protein
VINNQPKINVLFEIPKYKIAAVVDFLVDTGATRSILMEKHTIQMNLDCSKLPDCRQDSIGFGGTFKTRMINCPVRLTFGVDDKKLTIAYDNGFLVGVIPPSINYVERERLLRYTPSVLGMDILEKFKLYLDKKRVILET